MTVISGSPTTATLDLAADASGTATLMIGHAPAGGTPQSEVATIAPGGSASVTITPVGFGVMRVDVTMTSPTDRGVLSVSPPGPLNQQITGGANVGYTVVDGEIGTREPDE